MKTLFLSTLASLALLTGCASAGPQKPPTSFDRALMDIQTNTVYRTNIVTETNFIPQAVWTTNVDHVVVAITNQVPVVAQVPQVTAESTYIYTPKESITGTASAVGGMLGPWGTVGALALSGILGVFAKIKSKQADAASDAADTANQVAGSMSVALQTARSVIAALPNGQAYSASFNAWLAAHQDDVDIAKELASVVQQYVDPGHQQIVAAGILASTPIIAAAPAPAAVNQGIFPGPSTFKA